MTDEIASRVKALRLARGLSQEKLAKEGGLERVEIVAIENGKNQAGTARVRKALAKGARVGLEDLFMYLDGDLELEELLRGAPSTPRPYEGSFPNRQRAVEILREAHFAADVIALIEGETPPRDRTVYAWIKRAEAVAADIGPPLPHTPPDAKRTPPPVSPPKSTRRSGP